VQEPRRDAKNKEYMPPLHVMGPWEVFVDKANAIHVQRYVVPWFIALYGMRYPKRMKTEIVKEMVLALCPMLDFVTFDAAGATEEFPVGFAEVAKRIKIAAGNVPRDMPAPSVSLLTARPPGPSQNGLCPSIVKKCGKSWLTCSRSPSPSPRV